MNETAASPSLAESRLSLASAGAVASCNPTKGGRSFLTGGTRAPEDIATPKGCWRRNIHGEEILFSREMRGEDRV
jgi:hypothetical protein